VPAILSVYVKYALMAGTTPELRGFTIAARAAGKQALTLGEKLSFFRTDGLVALAVALVLAAAAELLPVRLRIWFVGVFSGAIALALYAQLRAYREVGWFVSLKTFRTALSWGWHEPAAYLSYLRAQSLLLVFVLLVLVISFSVWLSKSRSTNQEPLVRYPVMTHVFAGAFLLVLGLSALERVGLRQVPRSPFTSSILLKTLRAYSGPANQQTEEFAGLSPTHLFSIYHQLTGAPSPNTDQYWGSARGANVLFFVMETTPARFLPPNGNLADLPNLQALRKRSFVGLQHYTTFPRTHEAVFSILSSWYPSDAALAFEDEYPTMATPSIMRTLSEDGYFTAIYSPMQEWHSHDRQMFRGLGVEDQVYPPDSAVPPEGPLQDRWMTRRVDRDVATLELMKKDLSNCLAQRRKFAVMFLPQIAHFPYPDVPGVQSATDIPSRARDVLRVEDRWLGELVAVLRRSKQLNNTIIVIVGDHGVRTADEDPTFKPGMIDEYSFHVPLFIYAPMTLKKTIPISWLTSHIDIVPSVLNLLGVAGDFEEGSSIWDSALKKRRTYFFAHTVFGADGYYSKGRFYMRNEMSGAAYANKKMHFSIGDILPHNSPVRYEIRRSIAHVSALQQAAAEGFAESDPSKNRSIRRIEYSTTSPSPRVN